jgi:hypothetical protein
MGLVAHLFLGCFYTVCFIVAWRSLRAGDADVAAKYGIAGVIALAIDIGLFCLGVGLFS